MNTRNLQNQCNVKMHGRYSQASFAVIGAKDGVQDKGSRT